MSPDGVAQGGVRQSRDHCDLYGSHDLASSHSEARKAENRPPGLGSFERQHLPFRVVPCVWHCWLPRNSARKWTGARSVRWRWPTPNCPLHPRSYREGRTGGRSFREGDIDLERGCAGFDNLQLCLRLIDLGLIVGRVKLYHQIAFLHDGVIVDQHLENIPRHTRKDGNSAAVNLCVVCTGIDVSRKYPEKGAHKSDRSKEHVKLMLSQPNSLRACRSSPSLNVQSVCQTTDPREAMTIELAAGSAIDPLHTSFSNFR